MSFRNALTNLGNLNVLGIAHNYPIEQFPENLSRSQVPALLVMPIDNQSTASFREGGQAFEAIAFGAGVKTVEYLLTHLLLVAPIGAGKGMREHLPLLIDCIDNYMQALAADLLLGDSLEEAAQVRIELGIYRLGNTEYYGCAFRHRWLIGV